MTQQKTLTEHVIDVIKKKPAMVRLSIADRLAEGRFRVVASADRRSDGRIDTRSLAYTVLIDCGEKGWAPLCRVLRRHVLVERAPNTQTEARELLLQNGHGVPDDPAALG